MTWAKVDDRLHAHIKAVRAGDAMALWVLALSWCVAYLTDGELPEEQPTRLIGRRGPRMAAKLVEVKLWVKTDFGYRFHDWFDYQPARAAVEDKRAEAKTRMQRIRGVTTDVRANTTRTNSEVRENESRSSRDVRDSRPVPDPSRPSPDQTQEERRRSATHSTGASADAHAPASAREGLFEDAPKAPAKPAKARVAATPLPDPVPAAGTLARRVYDAIVTDRVLGPITRGPGDLAERISQPDTYPGLDVLGEVKRAGAWVAGKPPGYWSDGRKALLGWLARTQERVASTPKPVIGTSSPINAAFRAPEKIDWQGRRVVGAAPLPPGSAFAKTKEEHEAEEDRLYAEYFAATQPVKRTP